MTVSLSLSYAQSGFSSSGNEPQKTGILTFNQEEFRGRFSVLVQSDENYDYYVIDLSNFTDRFERIYFMNLTYSESKLISIDGDPEKGQAWFKSYYTNKETEVTCLFNDLKEKTTKAGTSMSSEEISAWLAKNDKFNNAK
jgi:hypothetical protein